MFGKSITHLIRLSGVLQALENAGNLIINFNNDIRHSITKTLKNEIHCSLNVQTDYATTLSITRANIVRAKKLVEYFVLHRLVMAGYPCDVSDCSNIEKLAATLENVVNFECHGANLELIKEILLFSGSSIECKDFLAKFKKYNAKKVIETFNYLDNRGMGEFLEIKNNKGPCKKIFQKLDVVKMQEIENLKTLNFFQITYEKYFKKFELNHHARN
jgi:hypothetical protein